MSLLRRLGRNRAAILWLTAAGTMAGGWISTRIPVSILPEVAFRRVGVIARASDLPVEQTLTTLTQPLEQALSGVLGVERIRSQTSRGGVEIDLRFSEGTDMLRARDLVQATANEARRDLPESTEIEARLLETSVFPILTIGVSSQRRPLPEVSDFVRYELAPELRMIPGVQRVEFDGAQIKEYRLAIDPQALLFHKLDLSTVEAAVRGANVIASSGAVQDGHQLVLTVVEGDGTQLGSLDRIVVGEDGGIPVTLESIAHVETAVREDFKRAAANGVPAVLVSVSRQPSGNSVEISRDVATKLDGIARAHPDLTFANVYDQADLVKQAAAAIRDGILVGIALAIAIVFFFIRDPAATLVAAAVIPTTGLLTAIALEALGMSFNLMTLGGFAAGIGFVVDDAIVVVENLARHRARGELGDEAAWSAVEEIAGALFGSTLTPVAVLVPLTLLSGVAGDFFRPLAVTLSIALLISLGLALTFAPVLAGVLAKWARRPGKRADRHGMARLRELYGRALAASLPHPFLGIVAAVLLVCLSVLAYDHLETGFVPDLDEGSFVLDYVSPPGTSLPETLAMLGRVDKVLSATPDVVSFARRTGAEMGFFLTSANRGDYSVRLRRRAERRTIEEVIADVRTRVASEVPGLRVEFIQVLQDMLGDLSGDPAPVEVQFFGPDYSMLEPTAADAARILEKIPGMVDVFDGVERLEPTFRVDVEPARARPAGLDADHVQHWLKTAIAGTVVGQVVERDRAIPLRLQYAGDIRSTLETTRKLVLVGSDGNLAPLAAIARFETGAPTARREREGLRPVIRVTGRLEDRDLGSANREVREEIARAVHLPPGVSIRYGGLYASQQRAFSELLRVLGAALAVVGGVLLVEFGSVAAVLAIVLPSALAVTGSLGAMWATGTPLNVSSLVGMIMVVGIVAKNGILLLEFALRSPHEAAALDAALIDAGRVRLRPILMTTLAAAAGLARMALGMGTGSEMQQPLAIAVLGGLASSMGFSLFGVPILYRLLSPPACAP